MKTLRRLLLPWLFSVMGGLLFAAEHPSPSEHSAPSISSVPAPSGGKAAAGGLTVGAIESQNLNLSVLTASQAKAESEAVLKLEAIQTKQARSNLMEFGNTLKEIIAMGVSEETKGVVLKTALQQLAELSENLGDYDKALQLWAEYVERYPTDLLVPEVFLRQGYIERKLGAYETAKKKFRLVIQASLSLGSQNLERGTLVALVAMSEIAETAFMAGNYTEAAEQYRIMLNNEDSPERLNVPVIRWKLVRSLSKAGMLPELIREATAFIVDYTTSEYQPEVRYLLAKAYKAKGDTQESLEQVNALLEVIDTGPTNMAEIGKQWKMLAGNDIGNELFIEGDYLHAVQVYDWLAAIDSSPVWRLPIYYQIGLCYENLKQNRKAIESYDQIIKSSQEPSVSRRADLKFAVDMARVRHDALLFAEELNAAARKPSASSATGSGE